MGGRQPVAIVLAETLDVAEPRSTPTGRLRKRAAPVRGRASSGRTGNDIERRIRTRSRPRFSRTGCRRHGNRSKSNGGRERSGSRVVEWQGDGASTRQLTPTRGVPDCSVRILKRRLPIAPVGQPSSMIRGPAGNFWKGALPKTLCTPYTIH